MKPQTGFAIILLVIKFTGTDLKRKQVFWVAKSISFILKKRQEV